MEREQKIMKPTLEFNVHLNTDSRNQFQQRSRSILVGRQVTIDDTGTSSEYPDGRKELFKKGSSNTVNFLPQIAARNF